MVPLSVRPAVAVELAVVLFQVMGFGTLLLTAMVHRSFFRLPCRWLFIVSLVGLGLASMICSQFDSKFALFGGATLTFFLIVTCCGHTRNDPIDAFSQTLGHDF